ncbi:hypothetical protein SK128_011804 [Halocaridina rubra]|uniref:Uncharacterized protein n=1 Tax=Halocaridina rubra TaxID=373956 RepID=A0AAN8WY09_HALRR
MVASHDPGQLVRSLVRIPGSGTDRNLPSACVDFSNISSLAGRVRVSRTLPPALRRPMLEHAPKREVGEASSSGYLLEESTKSIDNTRKRGREQDIGTVQCQAKEVSSSSPPSKMFRVAYMTKAEAVKNFPLGKFVNSSSGVKYVVDDYQKEHNHTVPGAFLACSASQLIKQRQSLLEENRLLRHQLILFKQLLGNKERLASVAKSLGVHISA